MVVNNYFSSDGKSKFSSLAWHTNPVLVLRMAWDVPYYCMLPSRMCHSKIIKAPLQDWQIDRRATKPYLDGSLRIAQLRHRR